MNSEREIKVTNYIYELSKEMGINNTEGLIGNELELIALVRNCKFLYDRNQPDFKEMRKKNAAWCAIANVINASVTDVQHRWRSLRDSYNKYKKDVSNSSNDEKRVVWQYYDEMKFIEPHIRHRSLSSWQNTSICDLSDDDTENSRDNTSESSFSFEEILSFITEIQKRPVLYDNKDINYKNKKVKFHNWKEVALISKTTVSECTIKWKRLRERYGRERRLTISGQNEGKTWELYNAMSFLDHIVKKRNRQSRLYKSSNEATDMNVMGVKAEAGNPTVFKPEDMNSSDIDDAIDGDVQSVEFIDTANTSSRSSYSSVSEHVNQNERAFSCNTTQTSTQTLEQSDEDDLFGQLIAAELKGLPRGSKKMKLKLDMYKLLCDKSAEM